MAIEKTSISNLTAITTVAGTELIPIVQDGTTCSITPTNLMVSKAPLSSPALTGTPTAPTASAGTSTTQIATTAFAETESISNAIKYAIVLG
jgi:hypothetical protein